MTARPRKEGPTRRSLTVLPLLAAAGLASEARAGSFPVPPIRSMLRPALSRTNFCFFDVRSAELNARSQAVVNEAYAFEIRPQMHLLASGQYFAFVSGHVDRFEPPAEQHELSQRRAQAVAGLLRLISDGMEVIARGYGSLRPIVPRSDVPEPQNRSAQIFLRHRCDVFVDACTS